MLVECWRVARALEQAGIVPEPKSANVARPGKAGGPVVRALIDGQLKVRLVAVPLGELEALWCLRKGNFHFWPVVRPDKPLKTEDDCKEFHRKLKELRTKADKDKVKRAGLEASPPDYSKLLDVAKKALEEHLEKLELKSCPDRIKQLATRLREVSAEATSQAFSESKDLDEVLLALWYGKQDGDKTKAFGQVAFDLEGETVYARELRQELEGALAVQRGTGPQVTCSIANRQGSKHDGKLPNPALPIVAPSGIAVFSMFSKAPTNTRYGLTDDAVICVTTETVKKCLDAIPYVTDASRKGQTWTALRNGKKSEKGEASDLLIVFASGIDAQVADGFGGGDAETDYKDVLQPVLTALEGKAQLTPNAEIEIVVIRQISNAQLQAVYGRTPKVSEVLGAGRRWQTGQWSFSDLLLQGPNLASPNSVVTSLSRQWRHEPPAFELVNGPSGGDVIDFMLAKGPDRAARAALFLDILLHRSTKLLTSEGSRLRRAKGESQNEQLGPAERSAKEACLTLTLILDAMDRTMEQTQHSPPYLLGLLLGVVDTLHLAYCRAVRASVPPSLGGSQLLGIAADDPTRALADLLERIRPWSDWAATKEPSGESENDILMAKKALSRLAVLSTNLSGQLCHSPLDQIGKAELLLGYLSKDCVADQYSPTTAPSATEPEQDHA
ncbi:MAG: hypothetical protein KF733_03515 [Fimbriimonadaceae bacterium]|nr:MAG: hypothetical protein KF733_03515 [Fimbriimonadaceae bacterium]